MPLFEKEHVPLPDEAFGLQCAKQLKAALRKHRQLVNNQYSTTKAAHEFDKLATEIGKTRVTEVLNWYCEEMPNLQFKVHSGTTFCSAFNRVADQMKKNPSKVEISADALQVWEFLNQEIRWRAPKDEVLQCIQQSLIAYRAFRKRVHDMTLNKHPRMSYVEIFGQLQWQHWQRWHPIDFIIEWMKEQHEAVHRWAGWHGNMDICVWSVRHRAFERAGRQLALRDAEDVEIWEQYLKLLYPEEHPND